MLLKILYRKASGSRDSEGGVNVFNIFSKRCIVRLAYLTAENLWDRFGLFMAASITMILL